MPGRKNEVRDPVHTFIEFDGVEREVIDSPPFQRLRHIHQRVTYELIGSDAMTEVWESVRPSPKPADVAKLVLGRGRSSRLDSSFRSPPGRRFSPK